MSVIVEFVVADEEFTLGQVLAEPPAMDIELERIVPTGSAIIPFLWVRGEHYETFEERVGESESVADFVAIDRQIRECPLRLLRDTAREMTEIQ